MIDMAPGPKRAGDRAPDIRLVVTSLATVALGVVLSVALLRYHVLYGGTTDGSGVLQQLVVGVYRALGFVPALYLGVLLLVWGILAFVRGQLLDPLRRIAATIVFALSFAMLIAAFGGNGGGVGGAVAARFEAAFGSFITVVFLVAMTAAALALSTELFFHRLWWTPRPVPGADLGIDGPEEDEIGKVARSVIERPEPLPVDGPGASHEPDLMSQVIEEARRDVMFGSPVVEIAGETEPEAPAAGEADTDLLADLDDEDLLAEAGAAIERAWSGDDLFRPAADIEAADTEAADIEAADTGAAEPPIEIAGLAEAKPAEPIQEELFATGPIDADLLDRAAKIILTARRPMPSLLQRRLDLSFAEARAALDELARLGVVSEPTGHGPWEALIDLPAWEERRPH